MHMFVWCLVILDLGYVLSLDLVVWNNNCDQPFSLIQGKKKDDWCLGYYYLCVVRGKLELDFVFSIPDLFV